VNTEIVTFENIFRGFYN